MGIKKVEEEIKKEKGGDDNWVQLKMPSKRKIIKPKSSISKPFKMVKGKSRSVLKSESKDFGDDIVALVEIHKEESKEQLELEDTDSLRTESEVPFPTERDFLLSTTKVGKKKASFGGTLTPKKQSVCCFMDNADLITSTTLDSSIDGENDFVLLTLDVKAPLTPQPRKMSEPLFGSDGVVEIREKLHVKSSVCVRPECMGPYIFNFDKEKNDIGDEKMAMNIPDLEDVGIPGDYTIMPFTSETASLVGKVCPISDTIISNSRNMSESFVVPHNQAVSSLLNNGMSSTMPLGFRQSQRKKSMILTINSTMKSKSLEVINSSRLVGNDSKSSDVFVEGGYAGFCGCWFF
jgi:hypothetical protein